MKTICVIQARFASSRLPGKVLERIGDRSMLAMIIERASRAATIEAMIVATSTEVSDDAVATAAKEAGARVMRGSQFDVLDRYYKALNLESDADILVRLTADCPFVDPDLIDLVVNRLIEGDLAFSANRLPPPHARTYPVGLDVEACTTEALRTAWKEATLPHQREHVMPYLYENPRQFRIGVVDLDFDLSGYRWTVDTVEDLAAVRQIAALVGPEPYGWRDVLNVAQAHPEIGELNRTARQKAATESDSRWEQDH